MEKKCLISFVIPVYNAEQVIQIAVDSLLPQLGSDCEIVMINDGSTDQSAKICDTIASQHGNICVYHQANSGSLAARIRGVKEAQGQYIAFLDADDIYYDNAVDLFRTAITMYGADVAFFDYNQEAINSREIKRITPFDGNELLVFDGFQKNIVYRAFLNGQVNTIWACIFRKEILQCDMKFERIPPMKVGEDRLQKLYALENAQRIVYIPQVCYLYKWYANSQFQKTRQNMFTPSLYTDFCVVWNEERRLYKEIGLSSEEQIAYDADKLERVGMIIESLLAASTKEYSPKKKMEYLSMLSNDMFLLSLATPDTFIRVRRYYRWMLQLVLQGRYRILTVYYYLCHGLKLIKRKCNIKRFMGGKTY